jgi:LemA protein
MKNTSKRPVKTNSSEGKAVWILIGMLAFFAGLALLIGIVMWGKYNRIQDLDEGVNGAWAQVEVVLQRRYDLIPNLVETVKGFAAQEREILTEVTALRSQWGAARSPGEKVAAANEMERGLGRLMLVAERYPDLKSNTNFLALQDELSGTENRIAVERRRFNEALQSYNAYIRKLPQSLLGYDRRDEYFEVSDPAAQQPPGVKF